MSDDLPRLLSLLSHELRAPLGVVRGYLRLIDGADLSETHRMAVGGALKASERLAEILAQVSTLAQLVRGETVFTFEDTPLEPVLAGVAQDVVLPTDPVIRLDVGSVPAVSVRADDGMLRVALTSLAMAIVRAQPRDSQLVLDARVEDTEDGRRVAIRAGPADGAVPEAVPLNLSRGGMGVELPIAQHVVAAHGGEIRELRDAGRVTGVIVRLPTSS